MHLEPGLAHLARRLIRDEARSERRVLLAPLALEYPFWEERFPEALARFGEPVEVSELPAAARPAELSELLAERLEAAQEALAAEALAREPAAFRNLLAGRAGVGGVYDLWRRLAARLRGERFEAEHGTLERRP